MKLKEEGQRLLIRYHKNIGLVLLSKICTRRVGLELQP